VTRTATSTDGRGVRVTLTPDGRRLAEDVAAQVIAELLALLSPVPPSEREHLARLAFAVVRNDDPALRRSPEPPSG
jgi:DNA-binding MarR family transcriptional regulator